MNSQKYKKEVYPEDFSEDEKLEFDILYEQSKVLFPKLANEEWLVRTGVIAFIRKKRNGDTEPPSDEEIAKVKNAYISQTSVYHFEDPIESAMEKVQIEA